MGKLIKNLVKITVASACVGGLCYAFKDKIKETNVYKEKNVDEKINKVKTAIKTKVSDLKEKTETEDVSDEDMDLDGADLTRDYIHLNTTDESETATDTAVDNTTDSTSDTENDTMNAENSGNDDDEVPTIEL